MRYICALLEADIVGHLTHRLAMKVSRFRYEIGLPPNRQSIFWLTLTDTILIGIAFTYVFNSSR
ncbi:hypothetical protein [Xenorhabdus japonica]|uniref:Uncharacterized protein n=1 Tax=Xenorhabdus japonica TaxID=53341 RepID=A0A1I4YPF8_9GAMM|nr:hypothetical protein [Xenorhabdus japonica]SFN39918.1 hypothetical protein SAMN05421579_102184 [Xenorhabdus japonica]